MPPRVLIVAAHADDEVLGCFGTVAKLIDEGYEAYTLILGEGKSAREESALAEAQSELSDEMQRANALIGIKEIFTCRFRDNRFDSHDLLDIIKEVERVKELIKPQIIFTHSANDLNIDHRITAEAVLTATRPMQNECVKTIFAFEVLSSSEWNFGKAFTPDTYFDISATIQKKIEAMRCYASELRQAPHPRSLEGIRTLAAYRGMQVGYSHAEAFKTLRNLR